MPGAREVGGKPEPPEGGDDFAGEEGEPAFAVLLGPVDEANIAGGRSGRFATVGTKAIRSVPAARKDMSVHMSWKAAW